MPSLNPGHEFQPKGAVEGFRRHKIVSVQARLEDTHRLRILEPRETLENAVLDSLRNTRATSRQNLEAHGTVTSVIRILGISGSLRSVSKNTTLLRAATHLTPQDTQIVLYEGIGDLPHFNPDLEATEPPAFMDLRAQLQASDAVLICTPEYAHGVPGVLKNALDWLVGSGEFSGKPVGLLNASLQSHHAQESLAETLRTMDARVITDACVRIPIPNQITEAEIVSSVEFSGTLRAAILALTEAVQHPN